MKNLRPETMAIIKRVETLSGCPVEFKPDSSLTLRATLQMARNGAPAHVFKYRPTNDPIDYWVAYRPASPFGCLTYHPMSVLISSELAKASSRWRPSSKPDSP